MFVHFKGGIDGRPTDVRAARALCSISCGGEARRQKRLGVFLQASGLALQGPQLRPALASERGPCAPLVTCVEGVLLQHRLRLVGRLLMLGNLVTGAVIGACPTCAQGWRSARVSGTGCTCAGCCRRRCCRRRCRPSGRSSTSAPSPPTWSATATSPPCRCSRAATPGMR